MRRFETDPNFGIDKSIVSMIDYKMIDHLKIIQSILLRRLQPEQINSVINMMNACRPSATKDERETALVRYYHS